jgi:hypothetical protein
VNKVEKSPRKPGIRKKETRLSCFDKRKREAQKGNRILVKYKKEN